MPLTLQQKQEILRSRGHDPTNTYLDESSGYIYEGQDPNSDTQMQESSPIPRVDNSPKTSGGTVFAKSFVTNLAPTAGALGAGSLGFRVPGPLPLKLVAGIGTSIAGGAAVSKLQEQIIPPSLYPTPEELEQHPVAGIAGQLAPSLMALDPVNSVKSLGRAGKDLGKLLFNPRGKASLMADEITALRNVALQSGVGAGTQAGLNIYNQSRDDKPFDPWSFIRETLVGGVLNEPHKLGTKLFGFKPTYAGVKTQQQVLAERAGLAEQTRVPEIAPSALDEQLKKAYGTEFNEPAYQLNFKAKNEKGEYQVSDADTNRLFKREYESAAGKDIVKGTGLTPDQVIKLTTEQKRDFLEQVMRERTDLSEDFGQLEIPVQTKSPYPQRPTPVKGKSVEIQQRTEYGEGGPGPYKYSGAETEKPIVVAEGQLENILDRLLRKRALKLGQYGKGQIVDKEGNVIKGSKGKPVVGRALSGQRTIDLATNPPNPETVHHEVGHVQLMDLATSKDAGDRALVSKTFAELGKPEITAEEFVRLNTEEARLRGEGKKTEADVIRDQYIQAEEELMQYMGLEGARRELGTGKFKQWFKDYISRFGVGEKPARQQISAAQRYEAPYGTRGVEAEGSVGGVGKMAEEEQPLELARENKTGSIKNKMGHYFGSSYHGTAEDYARYNTIQEELRGLKTKGLSLASPEGQALYKENETIKNKYGGMPPYPPKEQTYEKTRQDYTKPIRSTESSEEGKPSPGTKEEPNKEQGQEPGKMSESEAQRYETTAKKSDYELETAKRKLEKMFPHIKFGEEGFSIGEVQYKYNDSGPNKISELSNQSKVAVEAYKDILNGIDIEKALSGVGDYRTSKGIIRGQQIEEQLSEASFKAAKEVESRQRENSNKNREWNSFVHKKAEEIWREAKAKYNLDDQQISDVSRDTQEVLYGGEYASAAESRLRHYLPDELVDEIAGPIKQQAEALRQEAKDTSYRKEFDKANFKAQEAEAFERPDVERHSEEERSYETFEPSLAKELRKDHPFGLIPLRDDKSLAGNYVVDKLKVLPKIEQELLKQAGFEDWLREKGKRVTKEEIGDWLNKNGPQVKVESYGMEGKVSEAKKELDALKHEIDSHPLDRMRELADRADLTATLNRLEFKESNGKYTYYQDLIDTDVAKLRRLHKLRQQVENEPANAGGPRATSYYSTVSALPTTEPMPEWTATKSRKNVQRVDVVVPLSKQVTKRKLGGTPPRHSELAGGTTQRVGDEIVSEKHLWPQDNLHENLPNTLGWAMIQYKTGPNGEKIAVIAEAQSRWGQSVRKTRKKTPSNDPLDPYARSESEIKKWADGMDHPLLRDYNRLILKAAIDQARKEGATHIVISDSKSALMTEALDTQMIGKGHEKNGIGFDTKEQAENFLKGAEDYSDYKAFEHGGKWFLSRHQGGFDFNYDTSMPKIAEELTGSKGERVSLGEHKNAFQPERSVRDPNSRLGARFEKDPRENLIFKNPDGTPKTDVSGLMYPLKEVSAKLQQEPFSIAGSKFSESESAAYKVDPNLLPKKPLLAITTSVTDKIAESKRGSYIHEKVSSKMRQYFNEATQKEGYYGQSIVRAYQTGGYTPQEINNVYRHRWEKDNNLPTTHTLTSKENKLNDTYQTLIERPKEDSAALGLKVKRGETWDVGGIKPEGYLPNLIDPDVLWKLREAPDSIDAKKYKRQWAEWLTKKGLGKEEATKMIEDYLRAQREYGDTGGPEFKALRRPEGYGLPWELMDKNPVRASLRYGRRAANDIAYFKHLQSDPEILKALGLKDQYGNNPEGVDEKVTYIGSEKPVQDAMKFIWGKNESSNPRFAALMRLAGNLVMGHGTAIRNIAAIPTQMAPYDVRLRDIFNGLSNLSKTRERAYESGAARINPAEFDYLGDIGNPDRVVRTLDKMSDILRKYQGRNLSDKMEAEVLYSIGEEWAKNMIATKNDTMLKRATGKADYKIPEKPSIKDIQDIAAGFVRLTRGSYSPTGLPSWALTGNVAPFVALNRFGIEKWNNVAKDVIQPMKQGNLMPFLKYTLSGIMTGAMIEQLNEMLSGRKGSDANINETLAAYAETQDPELLAHKIIGLMQLSSYGGIVGDFAKMASRASQGKEISYSNPIGMPLYTLATETFGENLSAVVGAIRDGEDPINVLAELSKSIPLQTIQAGRYLKGHMDEESERKEAYRDIRVYKEATGRAGREELKASKGNPFADIEAKKFKKTDDIEEAVQMLPTLISAALKRAGGDVYKLKAEFRKLKANSFQVMPSPENQPEEFFRYVQYLQKSIGPEKTSERVSKFLSQRMKNQFKNEMVP